MLDLLRDIGLAFCPASLRARHKPNSSLHVLWAATLTGALETVVFSRWLVHSVLAFLAVRAGQYENVLQRQNETTQIWFFAVFGFEYVLVHPLAWLLVYLSFEGIVRFAAGLCVSEVIPSLPVVLAFKVVYRFRSRGTRRDLRAAATLPDALEVLPGERMRIAAALAKTRWNPSLTIAIGGECYEVEGEEQGSAPRPYIYVLRKAPTGKALRGYEEYDLAATVKQ
jgi:hypothetical protein